MNNSPKLQDVVLRQYQRVFRLCYSYVRNRADAEDLMQDVFEKFLVRPVVFTSEEHETAWFLRVASNTCKSHLRKQKLRAHAPLTQAERAEEGDFAESLALMDAIGRLPEKQRLCIHLYYYESLPQEKIAHILTCPVSTVKSHLRRARAVLKLALEGQSQ